LELGADFDATGCYRYRLWRRWNAAADRLTFIMLNPSTADASVNDPTIRRCVGFAQHWGYGSLEVVNLFAFRTPHPRMLQQVADPVGTNCDAAILTAVQRSSCVVLAWGNHGQLYERDQAVLSLLKSKPLYCLGLTQTGQPRHPLYLKQTTQLGRFVTQSRNN
jgi:hypothetical protein